MMRTLTREDATIAETSMCDVFLPAGDAGILVASRDFDPDTLAVAGFTADTFMVAVESHSKVSVHLSTEIEVSVTQVNAIRRQRLANGCDELTGDPITPDVI